MTRLCDANSLHSGSKVLTNMPLKKIVKRAGDNPHKCLDFFCLFCLLNVIAFFFVEHV